MPCHDILIETAIKESSFSQIEATESTWQHVVQAFGLNVPVSMFARASYDGTLIIAGLTDIQGVRVGNADEIVMRYSQAYVSRQIFDALVLDGYEMNMYADPDHGGTVKIEARNIGRNATIGVEVYSDLTFEIDFLDALHDDSVWLAGGEFGRVIERIKGMGLTAEIVKLDIDDDKKRAVANSSTLLA